MDNIPRTFVLCSVIVGLFAWPVGLLSSPQLLTVNNMVKPYQF